MTPDEDLPATQTYSSLGKFSVGFLWVLGRLSFLLLALGTLFLVMGFPLLAILYGIFLFFHDRMLSEVWGGLEACQKTFSELLWHAVFAGIGMPFIAFSGCAFIFGFRR